MIRHLHDVVGLEPLQAVAHDLGVELTATGALARKLYVHELLTPDLPAPDLFELTPFTTGIDLVHSGDREQTPAIMRAILRELTLPECFQWTIRSASEDARRRRAWNYGPVVPVHGVRLSTSGGFEDPMEARDDIRSKEYRYARNPRYPGSPRYRANRDLEVLGALKYLCTVLEDDIAPRPEDAGLAAVRVTMLQATNLDTLGRLQASAALRARLHRRVRDLSVAARTVYGRALIALCQVPSFLAFLDGESTTPEPISTRTVRAGATPSYPNVASRFLSDLDLDASHAITVSERVLGDLTRIPSGVEFVEPRSPSVESAGQVLHALTDESVFADDIVLERVTGWIPMLSGRVRRKASSQAEANEMIHFAYIETRQDEAAHAGIADEDISVLMVLRPAHDPYGIRVVAPLATCITRRYELNDASTVLLRCFRLSCGTAIERVAGSSVEAPLGVAFMVATRRMQAKEDESGTSRRKIVVDAKDFERPEVDFRWSTREVDPEERTSDPLKVRFS